MKNLFKKVAFVLALAMVLTNMGPAFSASAAEAPSLKYKSKVIYVDRSHFSQYENWCWTPSQNIDGYTVDYDVTTGEDLITVATNGKIKATGNGIGKAVVKVTYTPDAGGAVITRDFTVKVRRNAAAVRLTNAVIKEVEKPLAVGDEIQLIAAKTFDGSYAKGHYGLDNYMKVVSDQITYEVDDDSIIKVEDGKLVAVGAGTGVLSVIAYEYGDETKSPVCVKDYDIVVIGGMQSVKQVAVNKVEVAMGTEVKDLKPTDFVITRVSSKANIAVKEVKTEGTKVTLTTFASLNDGAEYTVKYDDKELTFVATEGTVTGITINTLEIGIQVPTLITFNLVDESGVVLNADPLVVEKSNSSTFTSSIETYDGYLDSSEGKLYLFEEGGKAKATAKYVTNKFDTETGAPIGTVEVTFDIVAVKQPAAVPGSVQYTITAGDKTAVDWSNYSKVNTLAVGDSANIHVIRKDSNDAIISKTYTLESSDTDRMIIGGVMANSDGTLYAPIVALKEGQAYVLVKDANGALVDSLAINIRAERKVKTFTMSEATFTGNNRLSSGASANDLRTITLKFFDQYGEEMGGDHKVKIETLGNTVDNLGIATEATVSKIALNPVGVSEGTYTYKVTAGDMSKVLTVEVKAPNTSSTNITYKLVLSANSADAAYKGNDDANKTIDVKVGKYFDGILGDYVVLDANNLKISDGDIKVVYDTVTGTVAKIQVTSKKSETISGAAISVIEKAKTGSFVVNADINGVKLSSGFVITDSQPAFTADIKTQNYGTVADYTAFVKAIYKLKYDGNEVNDNADLIVKNVNVLYPNKGDVADLTVAPTGTIAINTVTVLHKIGDNYVALTLNRPVSVTQ